MSAKERLQACEAQLRERGVVDVKFFFNQLGASLSEMANDVADVIEAALEGQDSPFDVAAELPNG